MWRGSVDAIKKRTSGETIVSDLTYDLRAAADFVDKMVASTFAAWRSI